MDISCVGYILVPVSINIVEETSKLKSEVLEFEIHDSHYDRDLIFPGCHLKTGTASGIDKRCH